MMLVTFSIVEVSFIRVRFEQSNRTDEWKQGWDGFVVTKIKSKYNSA